MSEIDSNEIPGLSPRLVGKAIYQMHQNKELIENLDGLQSNASEIDGIIKNGEFGETTVKIDTLPTTSMPSNTAVLDIHHQAQQGIQSNLPAAVVHNYTDSKSMQLDNVGTGDVLRLKNAYNPLFRLDKDNQYVGTGDFLVCEDSEIINDVEVNSIPFSIKSNADLVWNKTGNSARFQQNKIDDNTWGFTFNLPNSHRYPYRFENLFYVENNLGFINTDYYGNLRIKINGTSQVEIDNTTVKFLNNVDMSNLPTSDPLISGRLWNDNGTLKISA